MQIILAGAPDRRNKTAIKRKSISHVFCPAVEQFFKGKKWWLLP